MALIWLSALALLHVSSAAPLLLPDPSHSPSSQLQAAASRDLLQVDAAESTFGSAAVRDFLTRTFAHQPTVLQRVHDCWGQGAATGRLANQKARKKPDDLQMAELVIGRGYPLERHAVVTPDGYELVMFRIPHGTQGRDTERNDSTQKSAVLLQHGLTHASCTFVLFANQSLAFVLADAGFDVWLGNTRGTPYSRRTVNGLSTDQAVFWAFSIDTLALVDLPAQVDYVLQATGASKIGFLGHSQGCTLANMLLAAEPEYNDKFSVLVQMGPVWFAQFIGVPVARLISLLNLDRLLATGELRLDLVAATILGLLCDGAPPSPVCAAGVGTILSILSRKVDVNDYALIARTWPLPVSSREMKHWAQNIRRADLQLRAFDFGVFCGAAVTAGPRPGTRLLPPTCNKCEYGTSKPPAFDLTKVTAPTAYFLAGKDVLAPSQDTAEHLRRISSPAKEIFEYPEYAHSDFIWDRNMRAADDVVHTLLKYADGMSQAPPLTGSQQG